jgi:hypothetical protein
VFKQIGIKIEGARKFSKHLQSSKMSKTDGKQFFFDQCPNLEMVPNELLRHFQRTKTEIQVLDKKLLLSLQHRFPVI